MKEFNIADLAVNLFVRILLKLVVKWITNQSYLLFLRSAFKPCGLWMDVAHLAGPAGVLLPGPNQAGNGNFGSLWCGQSIGAYLVAEHGLLGTYDRT